MKMLSVILCVLFGYAVGTINPSYLIGRLRGFDIRKSGSGNAGASNAVITMGKKVGIFSAFFDIAKATAVFYLARVIFRDLPLASEIAAVSAVFGHIFPFYMKFRGGKGLACLGGLFLAVDWRLFLIALAVEILLVLWVNYICIVPITASVALPFLYWGLGDSGAGWLRHAANGWQGALILGAATLGILSRHVENIRRIKEGTEMHFSFLFSKNKDAELNRILQNRENQQNGDEP